MKNRSENIIQIRQRDIHEADMAFAEFMNLAENCLNEKAKLDVELYKSCEGKKLENVTESILKEIAPATPFRPEDIVLISGAKFPDIQAGKYYGVEVKSTKSNSWSSTGSSIVESTRITDVSKIYMMFGKLGGEHAEYRCRPYEECLSNIAVTHSPRYLIDMTLKDNQTPSIFDKMKIDYDTFRLLDEKDKIQRVRNYYKQSRRGFEMPWWIGDTESETSSSIMIRFFCDVEDELKEEILTRMLILFTELFRYNYSDKYKRAALWMCSRYSIINNSLRDSFSAGGRLDEIGGVHFNKPVPQILNTLYNYRHNIIKLLKDPDSTLLEDIYDYWKPHTFSCNLYDYWLEAIQTEINNNPICKDLNIYELMTKWY